MIKVTNIRALTKEIIISWEDDNSFSFGQIYIYKNDHKEKYVLNSENMSKEFVKNILSLLVDSLEMED